MFIWSLCRFSNSAGPRAAKATAAVQRILVDQRSRLFKICVAALVMQLVPLLLPVLLREFLGSLLEQPNRHLTSANGNALLFTLAGAVCLIGLIRSAATYWFLRWSGQSGHQFVATFRRLVYAHLLRLPVKYVERRGAGRVLLRFVGDTDALRSWISRTGPKLLADLVTAVLIFALILWISVPLALVFAVPLLAMAVSVAYMSRSIRRQTRYARNAQSRLTGYVEQRLNRIRAAKLIDADCGSRDDFRQLVDRVAALNADRDHKAAGLESCGQLISFSAFPLLLLVSVRQVWSGAISIGDWLALIWLALHFVALLRPMLSAVVIHQKAVVSLQRLHRLLSRAAEAGRSVGTTINRWSPLEISLPPESAPPQLAQDDLAATPLVFFCHGPGCFDVPRRIDADRFFAALLGFKRWRRVRIKIGDRELDEIEVTDRRRGIFYLAPQPFLVESSVAANALLFWHESADTQARGRTMSLDPFHLVELPEHVAFKPGEHEARVQPGGIGLSPRQRRAIALLQPLFARPHVLLIPSETRRSWPPEDLDWLIEKLHDQTIILRAAEELRVEKRSQLAAPGWHRP